MYASIWNWERVSESIKSLRGRLGFPDSDKLSLLGFELNLNDGKLRDIFLSKDRDDVAPNVYFVLYRYAHADREHPETGKLITFRQIYGGDLYYTTYKNNVLNPLNKELSDNIELLTESCKMLEGTDVKVAGYDISMKIYVLPYVPIYVAVDLGGEEFPPLITLFYDESINNYFTAEETSHLSEIFAMRVIELSKELSG